jgi:hypothetical protein
MNHSSPDWDSAPIIGISAAMGLGFFKPGRDGWARYTPPSSSTIWATTIGAKDDDDGAEEGRRVRRM